MTWSATTRALMGEGKAGNFALLQFLVKFVVNGVTKTTQGSRANGLSWGALRSKIASAAGGNYEARYSGASGDWYIENDDHLKAALADTERAKKPYLRLVLTQGKTAGAGAAPAAAPQHVARSPAPAASAPAAQSYSAPSHAAAPAAAPAQAKAAPAGTIAQFTLPGSGTAEKIKIEPQQTAEYFLFNPIPSKYQTDVTVVLEGTKLVYHNTYTFQDGAQLKTMNLTQTFNLPFAPSADQVSVNGNQVKLMIPQ